MAEEQKDKTLNYPGLVTNISETMKWVKRYICTLFPMKSVTYSELMQLISVGGLNPGRKYRITDYKCTVNSDESYAQATNHKFDIVVTADDVDLLNENATAMLHENDEYFADCKLNAWQLKYSVYNDTNRFTWADSGSTGRGVVYYLKDEWNNECPYDFKNIQFKRYKISATTTTSTDLVGTYNAYSTSMYKFTVDSSDYIWAYTFNWMNSDKTVEDLSVNQFSHANAESGYSNTYNNKISERRYANGPDYGLMELNNCCVLCNDEYEGGLFYGICGIKIQNDCCDISCGNNCYNISCGSGCYGWMCGDDCCNWSCGNECSAWSCGNECSAWSCGGGCTNWTCGNTCSLWSCGNGCSSWTCGDSCYNWSCGNGCSSWTCGDSCYYWSCGNECYGWSCGNNCYNWSCGNNCEWCTWGNYFENFIIDNGCQYLTISAQTATSSSSKCNNFHIHQGVKGTYNSRKTITIPTNNNDFQIDVRTPNDITIYVN